MPDLSFSRLQAALPNGAVIESSGDVLISAKTLMDEGAVSLSDAKVSEFIAKFLNGCALAQNTHNASNGNEPDLNGFPSASAGVPFQNESGAWFATFDYSVSVQVPLSPDETTGTTI